MSQDNRFRQIDQEMQKVQRMVQETLLQAELDAKTQQVQLLRRALQEIQSLVPDNCKTPKKSLCETVYYTAENALIAADLVEHDPTIFNDQFDDGRNDQETPDGYFIV